MLVPLVLLPLTIWAVGATAAAIWGWSEVVKANRRPNLFDQFPDVEGDNPGVRKGKPAALDWSPATAVADLPASTCVPLGGVLALGDRGCDRCGSSARSKSTPRARRRRAAAT